MYQATGSVDRLLRVYTMSCKGNQNQRKLGTKLAVVGWVTLATKNVYGCQEGLIGMNVAEAVHVAHDLKK